MISQNYGSERQHNAYLLSTIFLTHVSSLFHTQYAATSSDRLHFLEFPVSEQLKRLREKRDKLDKQREELDKQRDELDNQIFKLSAQQESQQQITLHSDVKVKGKCQHA